MSQLKPCPFDGGKAVKGICTVWCAECDASNYDGDDIDEAIAAWNKRVPSEEMAGAFEKCAKIAEEPRIMILTKANIEDGMLDDDHPVIRARAQMREEIAAAIRAAGEGSK